MDQGDDDLSLAGSAGALDEDVVAADDVLVAHGIAADLEREDVAVADHVVRARCFPPVSVVSTGRPAAMRPASGSRSLVRVRVPGGSTSIDRLRLCTRSSMPFFSRLVMCLCTVARLLRPMPRAISSNDGE